MQIQPAAFALARELVGAARNLQFQVKQWVGGPSRSRGRRLQILMKRDHKDGKLCGIRASGQSGARREPPFLKSGAGRNATRRIYRCGPRARRTATETDRAANGGKSPQKIEAVIPYFASPQEHADFVECSEAAKALGMKL